MLICGLVFWGGKDKFMCCKNFLRRAVSFAIALSAGILSVSLFFGAETVERKIESVAVPAENITPPFEKKSCVQAGKSVLKGRLQKELWEYEEKKAEKVIWLKQNPDAPAQAKSNVRTMIKELEKMIARVKVDLKSVEIREEFQKSEGGFSKDLLYREECYEF